MQAILRIGLWTILVGVAIVASAAEVSELIDTARSPDAPDRLVAIGQLGLSGAHHPVAIDVLASLLKDPSPAVRAHAAEALGVVGQPALRAVPAMLELVADPDAVVRRETLDAIRKIRPGPKVAVPMLVKVLKDSDDAARIRVIAVLADQGKNAVPGLIEALDDPQAKYWACLVVSEIGPEAEAAVPALIRLLDDEMPDVRREAILALAAIGPAAAPAAPRLATALNDKMDRVPATYALGSIGRVSPDVQAKIRENAADADVILNGISQWALAKLNPTDEKQVSQAATLLAEQLKNKDRRIRFGAARLLADLNPPPEISQPALKKVMDEADSEAFDAILEALASQGDRVMPRLIHALENPTARLRAAALIARIGPPAAPATAALIAALKDDRPAVRSEVLFALAAIGPEAAEAVPAAIQALGDDDPMVRYAACHTLGSIGPKAEAAKTELQKHLDSEDDFLGLASACALARICPDSRETAPKSVAVLTAALGQPEPLVRVHAAEALGRLGPLAKSATPVLESALRDESKPVRAAAQEALDRIGGKDEEQRTKG